MQFTFEAAVHAAVFLLFLAAGLLVSLVAALTGAVPVGVTMTPTLLGIAVGHVVASRVAAP